MVSKRPHSTAGSLVVVGIGIQWAGQTTPAAQQAIVRADRVYFAVSDPWAAHFIRKLNPRAEPLPYPRDGRTRRRIYREMCGRILGAVKGGERVCAAFYGSAAVLTRPAHDVITMARRAGLRARMLPGVSFLECLFADLGIDPGVGLQFFEAGYLLSQGTPLNTSTHVVLSQIALIDNLQTLSSACDSAVQNGLARLQTYLETLYPSNHELILYEAATHPLKSPRIEPVLLASLSSTSLHEISTLYIPPQKSVPPSIPVVAETRGSAQQRPEPCPPDRPDPNCPV